MHALHIKCPKPTQPCFTETSSTNFSFWPLGWIFMNTSIFMRLIFFFSSHSTSVSHCAVLLQFSTRWHSVKHPLCVLPYWAPSVPQAVKVPVPRVRCSASVKNFFHAPLKTHFTSEVAHFDVPEMEPQIWPRSYFKLRRSKSVVFSGYLDSPSPPRWAHGETTFSVCLQCEMHESVTCRRVRCGAAVGQIYNSLGIFSRATMGQHRFLRLHWKIHKKCPAVELKDWEGTRDV